MKPNIKIEKSIFQIKYKPVLSFYDNLYKKDNIFNQFPHWQTDRLKVTLRDYEKRHSLTLKHDSIIYETDNYSNKFEKDIINLISDNINEITTTDKITRIGHRFFCLAPVKISFNELVTILNLKLFSKDFINSVTQKIDDSTVTITSTHADLKYRLQVGPMKDKEVPGFIIFNIENHIDASSTKKYSDLAELVENYPETSFYIDLDLLTQENASNYDILKFYKKTKSSFSEITNSLLKYIFEEKLK